MELNFLDNTNCSECLIGEKIPLCSKRLCLTECGLHDQYFVHSISNVINLIAVNINNKNTLSVVPIKSSKYPWLIQDFYTIRIEKIPPSIRTLWNLVYLDLGPNDISKILNKTCNLNKLPILLTESHCLTQLPKNIGNLISLKVVKLNQNQLVRLPDFVKYLQQPSFLDLCKNNIDNIPKALYKLVIPRRIDRDGNFYNAMHVLIKNIPYKKLRENVYNPTIMEYSNAENDKSKFHHNYHECERKTLIETEFSSPCDETENWDISDDSTDEYDPTVCKEPRMKRVYLPFGIYGQPGGIFCPADLHPPSIMEQLYQMQQNSTQDKSEEGQFDDA